MALEDWIGHKLRCDKSSKEKTRRVEHLETKLSEISCQKNLFRLHPPVPLLPREVTENQWGYDTREKQNDYNVWAISRDSQQGIDANSFQPEAPQLFHQLEGTNFKYLLSKQERRYVEKYFPFQILNFHLVSSISVRLETGKWGKSRTV